MLSLHDSFERVTSLFKQKDKKSRFLARQLLFLNSPLSKLVELYLYNNEGQPQKLDKFPMMRAIYNGMPSKLLLKCSRKTLKSTLISNIIALNMIRYNYYRMMYVAPNEQATKRFSHDYLSARFTSPPITRIISKLSKNDVYVKEVEETHSNVILTYACEDASRTRGPATMENIFDESLSISTTYVNLENKSKKLVDVAVGDVVYCKNEYNNITTDRVKYFKREGVRHTWRITLESGEQIECTSRTKIFTNIGWVYLTQLLPKSEIDRCEKARYFETIVRSASPAYSRNFARRWIYVFKRSLSKLQSKSRFQANGLCAAPSQATRTVYKYTPDTLSESRIRKGEVCLFYGDYSGIRVYTQSMLQEGGGEVCGQKSETQGEKSCLKASAIKSIEYAGEQEVCDIETEKYHNFFANGILVHNCQGMNLDIIPIINETMAISGIKREIYAGTPLTTDNTLSTLWKTANQIEWVTKCSGCNHWNSLTEDNEPLKMIQKKGLSCSKCGKVIDTSVGRWADFNPGATRNMVGFHMAQPILPHYNQTEKGWKEIYDKCFNSNYSLLQVYNEVFGLPYDIGAKPIPEEKLKSLCLLGPMNTIFERNHNRYVYITMGVDWGVSSITSRTVCNLVGFREDGVSEVFYIKIFKNVDYEQQIRELADLANAYQPALLVDSGPDPIRGKMLGNLYDPARTQLIQYREGVINQFTDIPTNAQDWSQTRWCLNRSEVIGFTIDLLKKNQILFPRWEDSSEGMQDILSIFTEVVEDNLKSRVFYRHRDPDDMMHTLTWAVCAAHLWAGNSFFQS